jgi:hypothetical protein
MSSSNPYFEPPDNLNYDYFSPLFQLALGAIIVIGGLIIVVTIYFAIKNAIKTIVGSASLDGKFFLWLFIGLIVGILLIGGGWLGIINMIHKSVVEPGQEIVYEKTIYDI